jgi:hypothetical protein
LPAVKKLLNICISVLNKLFFYIINAVHEMPIVYVGAFLSFELIKKEESEHD